MKSQRPFADRDESNTTRSGLLPLPNPEQSATGVALYCNNYRLLRCLPGLQSRKCHPNANNPAAPRKCLTASQGLARKESGEGSSALVKGSGLKPVQGQLAPPNEVPSIIFLSQELPKRARTARDTRDRRRGGVFGAAGGRLQALGARAPISARRFLCPGLPATPRVQCIRNCK